MADEFFDGLILGRGNAFKRRTQEENELRRQHEQLVEQYRSLQEENRQLRAGIEADGALLDSLKTALAEENPGHQLAFPATKNPVRMKIFQDAFDKAIKDPNL